MMNIVEMMNDKAYMDLITLLLCNLLKVFFINIDRMEPLNPNRLYFITFEIGYGMNF